MRRTAALSLVLLSIAGTAGAQRIHPVAPPPPRAALGDLPPAAAVAPYPRPPASASSGAGTGLVIGELLASAAGALVGGFAGYKAAEAIADDRRVEGDAGYSPAGNVGWAAGSFAGAVVAPWLVAAGAHRAAPRSLTRAALGAVIPSAALLLGIHEPYLPVYAVIFAAPLQTAGAVLGLNAR